LVAAFDHIAGTNRDAVLVLGGQIGWGLTEIERALGAARHPDRIIRTGYLPDATVPALLRQATVVACPALAEGFGLPALEAMACGAPLVTTEGTAMAEMAQGAALLVKPGDVATLADALLAVLERGKGSSAVSERRALGLQLAATHTWEASANRHLEAYQMARTASQ
jgi:glycosyltransferase involved in cell wall biosynthesis